MNRKSGGKIWEILTSRDMVPAEWCAILSNVTQDDIVIAKRTQELAYVSGQIL
jgi:hypothetical protein